MADSKMNFAKELASLALEHTPSAPDMDMRQFSVRVNIRLFCYLEEVAKRTNLSRTATVAHLLKAGMDAFMAELPDEVADKIHLAVEIREQAEFDTLDPHDYGRPSSEEMARDMEQGD